MAVRLPLLLSLSQVSSEGALLTLIELSQSLLPLLAFLFLSRPSLLLLLPALLLLVLNVALEREEGGGGRGGGRRRREEGRVVSIDHTHTHQKHCTHTCTSSWS